VSANAGFEPDQELLEQMGIHASETAWVGTNFDGVLDNNGGIQDLYDQIKSLVQFPRASTANGIYKPLADSLGILS
jgi:hypothetical protein